MVPLSFSVKLTALLALASGLEAQSRFVYSNNDVPAANTIFGFSANSNGVLTQIAGSLFATGGGHGRWRLWSSPDHSGGWKIPIRFE